MLTVRVVVIVTVIVKNGDGAVLTVVLDMVVVMLVVTILYRDKVL